jgi:hypothetical protein
VKEGKIVSDSSSNRATLDTHGVSLNVVKVTATCAGISTVQEVLVTIGSSPVAAPEAKDIAIIEFKRDLKHPTRVDNGASAELDRYADALAFTPDAKGVVVGYAMRNEKSQFSAQRAVNTKHYLTKEKGIDPARIELRTGSDNDQRTDLFIIPAGAIFPEEPATKLVDENTVKPIARVLAKANKAH